MTNPTEERPLARSTIYKPALVFFMVWVAVAAPLLWVWFNSRNHQHELLRSQCDFAARVAAERLREHVTLRITAATHLVSEARTAPKTLPTLVKQRAEALHGLLPDLQAINWIDPSGHIAWVVPEDQNLNALGKSPLESALARPSFEEARRTLSPRMTEPLTLFQGGTGVAVYLPVRATEREQDLGYFNLVFRVDTLGELLFDSYTSSYFHLLLRDGDRVLFRHGPSPDPHGRHLTRASVSVLDARWELLVEPDQKLAASLGNPFGKAWIWIAFVTSFGLAALAGRYAFVAMERKRHNVEWERANETVMRAAKLVGQEATLDSDGARELMKLCCDSMGVTRAALWRYEARSGTVNLVAMFDSRVQRHFTDVKIYAADYPEYWSALCSEGRVVVRDAAMSSVTRKLYAERMPMLRRVAMLDVGIRSEAGIMGLFSFHRVDASEDFRPEERLLAQSMADLFALSWERADKRHAEAATTTRNARLAKHSTALGDIATLLRPDRSFEAVIAQVVHAVREALGAWTVSYWSLAEPREPLASHHLPGAPPPPRSSLFTSRDQPLDERLIRDSAVRVDDLAADPDYAEYYLKHLQEFGHVAALRSTVVSRREPVGLLTVLDRERSAPWYPEDPIFLSSVANMLSLHLEMLARRAAEVALSDQVAALVRHSEALTNIAKSWLGGLGHTESLASLTEIAAKAVQSTSASVWLEQGAGVYRLVARFILADGCRESGEISTVTQGRDFYDRVAAERCVSIVDGANDPCFKAVHATMFPDESLVSFLASGIRQNDNTVGFVAFVSRGQLRTWTVDEQLFAAALADLVSLNMEQEARRLAEQSMFESQQRTNLLVAGTPLAAIDWDTEGRVVGWNPAAERLFGYSRQEVLGSTLTDLLSDGYMSQVDSPWLALKSGVNLVERIRSRDKHGQPLTCDWRNTLLCDAGGRELGIMSLVEDVSGRVRAEEEIKLLNATLERRVEERTLELADANRQLRELDRLKNEFLATMSHELRTPLNSVIGFSSILKAGMAGEVNEEQVRQLDMINQSARHLLGLINDLLDLSRIEAGHVRLSPTELDPGLVLREVEQTLRPMTEHKAALAPFRFLVQNNAEGMLVKTDRTRLLQILINLANNAVKFTHEGFVCLELQLEGEGLLFQVRDSGPGISQENLRHLFEAFHQIDGSARRQYEGTGLGLYLSKKLVGLLGGEMRVESELGVGSCFSVWLPLRSSVCAS